jgi:hypothetical protein
MSTPGKAAAPPDLSGSFFNKRGDPSAVVMSLEPNAPIDSSQKSQKSTS